MKQTLRRKFIVAAGLAAGATWVGVTASQMPAKASRA